MTVTLEEIKNMVENLRKVEDGDKVLTTDILSIKGVCLAIIEYLNQKHWYDALLDDAIKELERIPPLKYGEIINYEDRNALSSAISYIYMSIIYHIS